MRVQTVLQRTRQQPRAAEREAPCTAPSRRLQQSKTASPAPSLAQWWRDVHGSVGSVLTAGDRHRAGHLLAGARVNCRGQFNITGRYAKLLRNRFAPSVRITPVMSCALAPAALSLCGLLLQAFSPCPPLGVGSKTGLVMRCPSAFCCVVAARVGCLWCCAASRAIV